MRFNSGFKRLKTRFTGARTTSCSWPCSSTYVDTSLGEHLCHIVTNTIEDKSDPNTTFSLFYQQNYIASHSVSLWPSAQYHQHFRSYVFMAIMPSCRILSYTPNRLHTFRSECYENCLRPKGCIFICTCFCHALCIRQDRKCTWT